MKKVLFCASAASHITNFHIPYLNYFKDLGYEVHTATKDFIKHNCVGKSYNISFSKKIYSVKNLKAIVQLKKIIRQEKYEIISTHSMLAGAVCRLSACLLKKSNILIVHTCHGYLFKDDNSFKSNLFILLEKYLSKYTDCLMVMNKEDYNIATKYNFAKNIKFINGMGVDDKIFPIIPTDETNTLKNKLNIKNNDFVFLCVGEFSKRKNQAMLINAFEKVVKVFPNTKLILIGDGKKLVDLKKLVLKLNIKNNVIFTGQIKNVNQYYQMVDVVVSTSLSEGLPFNIMESQLCKTPVIASNVKGHIDLIIHNETGLLFDINNVNQLQKYMIEAVKNSELFKKIKKQTGLDNKYYIKNVKPSIQNIYFNLINNN